MRITLLTLISLIICGSAISQTYHKDTETIENTCNALLKTISADSTDWNRFKNLFHSSASITTIQRKNNSTWTKTWTVNEFSEYAGTWYSDNGFKETCINLRIDQFANIANVFQTYETFTKDAGFTGRGINSIQLIYTRNRWWITNLIWDSENADNKIPDKYLK